jgi:hypothetical protein
MNVTSSTPGRNVLSFKLSGSEKMRIASDGSVGIGTAAPAYKLDVIGSGSDNIVCRIQSGGANTYTTYVNTGASNLDVGTGSGGHFVYGYGSYPLLFGVNGSEKMRITSAGNVGISSPSVALDVNGATKIRGALDLSTQNITNANQISATTNLVLQPTGGNVGIGTSTPTSALDVSGITTLRGNLDMSNNNIVNAGSITATVLNGRLPALGVVSTSSTGVNILTVTGFNSANYNDTLSLVVNFKVSPAANYNMQLYINGDTTPTNYWTEYTQDYTLARANLATFMQSGGVAAAEMFMKFIICRSRISGGHIVKGEGGFHAKTSSTGGNIQHWTCFIWHNSDTDITSLAISSTTANILGPAAMRVYPW